MTKRILLPVFLFLTIPYCHSQSSTRKPYLSLSVGAALPIGSFGKKDLNEPSSGFASIGPSLQASAKFSTGKRFGITATILSQINRLDVDAMEEQFSSATFYRPSMWASDGTTPQTVPSPTPVTYRNWEFKKGKWFMVGLQAGVYADCPLNEKTQFTGKIMSGTMYVSAPHVNGQSLEADRFAEIDQEDGHTFAFAWSASAGLRSQLNKSLSIQGHIDYFGIPAARFNDMTARFTATEFGPAGVITITQSTVTADTRQKISTIGINIGIGLQL